MASVLPWEFIGTSVNLRIPDLPATPTHNNDDGHENRLQFSPRIWYVSFSSSYHTLDLPPLPQRREHGLMRPSLKSSLRSYRWLGLFTPTHTSTPTSLFLHSRTMASSSSSNPPPPAERAAEIVDKLPSHPSLITKTGTAILGSGLLATAISQELYVFNEETVIAVGYLILFAYIAKVRLFLGPRASSLSWSRICELLRSVKEKSHAISPLVVQFVDSGRGRDGRSADQNVLARRPFASRTKSGPRITLLA